VITSCTCYSTEDVVRIVNLFITIPVTRNYIHSQLFLYAVSPLHSLQFYTFVTTITYSTLTRLHSLQTLHSNLYCTIAQILLIYSIRLHRLTSQLSITISNYHTLSHTQRLQFTLRADCDIFFIKLSPRSYSVNSLLKTPS
jgi:hypothetical protein